MMNKNHWRTRSVLAVIFSLFGVCFAAAGVIPITFQETVDQAELIFAGEVAAIDHFVNPQGFPVTRVSFTVERLLRDDRNRVAGPAVVLEFPGGPLGEFEYYLSEIPRFREGQRVVILAGGDETTLSPLVGVNQGLFYLETEPASGREVVVTCQGEFLTGINAGRLVTGGPLRIDDDGEFAAASAAPPDNDPASVVSKDPAQLTVRRVRPVPRASADPAEAMSLDGFLAAIAQAMVTTAH